MAGSCSPLRRRLRVMLRKSGALDFDVVVEVFLEGVGKHSGRRVAGHAGKEGNDAARLSVPPPAGPACWCPAASRKSIIPCLALETGTKEGR